MKNINKNILQELEKDNFSKEDYKQFVSNIEYFCSQIEDIQKHILLNNTTNKFNETDVSLINDIYNILLLLKKEISSNPNAVINDTYFSDSLLLKERYNLFNLGKYNYSIKLERDIK